MALLGFLPPNFPIYVQIINYGSVSLAEWITFPGAVADAIMAALAGTLIAISQNVQSLRKPIATSVGARWTFIVLFILLICSLIIRLIFVPKYKDANKN